TRRVRAPAQGRPPRRPRARLTVDYHVRPATIADAEPICHISNQGIEDRLATLETELRTPDERRQWLSTRSPRHPVIVAIPENATDNTPAATPTEPTSTSNRPPPPILEQAAPAPTIPMSRAPQTPESP